jgi:phosphoserine aminotransferase
MERFYLGDPKHRRDYNFCPGPCLLPEAVMEQAQREMMNWRGTGTSVNELNHRDAPYMSIQAEAESDVRRLLNIPNNFKVLFMQGGATN